MNLHSAGCRAWVRVVRLAVIAGLTPFAGCAVTGTGEEIPAWIRPWKSVNTPAERQDVAAGGMATGTTSATMAASEPVQTAGQRGSNVEFASAGIASPPWTNGPPPAYPLGRPSPMPSPGVQLASDNATSARDSRVQLARVENRVIEKPSPRIVLHVDETTFDRQVLRSDEPVLVDFYATWCGPCKRLAPTLDELAAESPGARVVKVNIDDSPELADRYGVHSIPNILVFKNGRVVAKEKGVVSKSRLKSMLDL